MRSGSTPFVPVLRRWLVFSFVGGAGMIVQLSALTGLLFWGLDYLSATALGVEAAIVNNFLWHERWTWRDRAMGEGGIPRFIRFNLTVGAISIAQNLVLMKVLVGYAGFPPVAGNLIVIAVCGLANFMVSDRIVFRRPGHPCFDS